MVTCLRIRNFNISLCWILLGSPFPSVWEFFCKLCFFTLLDYRPMLNVCLRYEEMANNPNVEYTAGGNGFIAQIMKFKNCFSIWFQWIILINDEFNLILLSAGATQNSIRVAQVLYYFLLRGVEEFSSIIPLLSKWLTLCFCSGCFKFLVQRLILVALARTSLERRWRRTQSLLVSM